MTTQSRAFSPAEQRVLVRGRALARFAMRHSFRELRGTVSLVGTGAVEIHVTGADVVARGRGLELRVDREWLLHEAGSFLNDGGPDRVPDRGPQQRSRHTGAGGGNVQAGIVVSHPADVEQAFVRERRRRRSHQRGRSARVRAVRSLLRGDELYVDGLDEVEFDASALRRHARSLRFEMRVVRTRVPQPARSEVFA